MSAIDDIAAERKRQIEVEGYDARHDDAHTDHSLAVAAACYATNCGLDTYPPADWPWDWKWWKPKNLRQELVVAGALIVAEIERLDRFAAKIAATPPRKPMLERR